MVAEGARGGLSPNGFDGLAGEVAVCFGYTAGAMALATFADPLVASIFGETSAAK